MKRANLTTQEIKTLAAAARIAREKKLGKKTLVSGLESLVSDFLTPTINTADTLELNLRKSPITFNRADLSYLYLENGIIRTAIDQPIDDALRGGVDIESGELDVDDKKALLDYMDDNNVWEQIKNAMRWGRLFGGGGLIINNGEDPATPLSLETMTQHSPLAFEDADRWELCMPNKDKEKELRDTMYPKGNYFYYYGRPIHRSRVLTVKGDAAPSLTAMMFMGWGVSEVEKMIRDLNQYLKAQNVIFELLDEAKIDVYRLFGYKKALITPKGQANITKAIGLTNSMKSFLNALILDKEDEYDQKTLTFSGLAEMLREIRVGIAATLRMPVTKLFGLSAAGFNSGEDDIENYNAMIESSIRSRLKPLIQNVLKVVAVKLFGYVPELRFTFKSLRIARPTEVEDIKSKQQMRHLENYRAGLLTAKEALEAQRADGLINIDKTAVEQGLLEKAPEIPAIQ